MHIVLVNTSVPQVSLTARQRTTVPEHRSGQYKCPSQQDRGLQSLNIVLVNTSVPQVSLAARQRAAVHAHRSGQYKCPTSVPHSKTEGCSPCTSFWSIQVSHKCPSQQDRGLQSMHIVLVNTSVPQVSLTARQRATVPEHRSGQYKCPTSVPHSKTEGYSPCTSFWSIQVSRKCPSQQNREL